MTEEPATAAAAIANADEVVDLPERFHLEKRFGGFKLTRRWLRLGMVCFMTVWCVVWDTVIGTQIINGTLPLLFVFTHGGGGLIVTYCTLAQWLNKTTVSINHNVLSVRHGPLPWPGARDLVAADVRQLTSITTRGSKGRVFYGVRATLDTGRTVDVVTGLANLEQAKTIERLVEAHLHIVDDGH